MSAALRAALMTLSLSAPHVCHGMFEPLGRRAGQPLVPVGRAPVPGVGLGDHHVLGLGRRGRVMLVPVAQDDEDLGDLRRPRGVLVPTAGRRASGDDVALERPAREVLSGPGRGDRRLRGGGPGRRGPRRSPDGPSAGPVPPGPAGRAPRKPIPRPRPISQPAAADARPARPVASCSSGPHAASPQAGCASINPPIRPEGRSRWLAFAG